MVWEKTVRLQLAALKICSSYLVVFGSSYLVVFNCAVGFQIAINANIRYHGLSFIMPANPLHHNQKSQIKKLKRNYVKPKPCVKAYIF